MITNTEEIYNPAEAYAYIKQLDKYFYRLREREPKKVEITNWKKRLGR